MKIVPNLNGEPDLSALPQWMQEAVVSTTQVSGGYAVRFDASAMSERTRFAMVVAGIETGSDRLKQRVPASELSDAQMAELLGLFDTWEDIAEGATIEEGTLLTYQSDALYRCISEHDKQATWTPPTAVSLFVSETPPGVIPAWTQPAGSHDAYGMGFIVEHDGSFWESTNAANVWEPPPEWTEIADPTA